MYVYNKMIENIGNSSKNQTVAQAGIKAGGPGLFGKNSNV
jgi:hypothetical protein